MDPLTAIGLAGNIISFIDVTSKVLSKARQLYNAASGATPENDELESLTKNLRDLADRARRKSANTTRHDQFSLKITSETVLESLSQQCVKVADELLDVLESVKVKGEGRTLKSAVQAVKSVWKQDDIDAIQRRLDRISKQLMDGTSMDRLEQINRRLREMAVENTRLEANRTKEISQLRQDLNSAIESIKSNVEEEQIPGAWLVLSDTARLGQAYFAEQVILQSLRFSSIESRHEAISKEHSKTFSWIFNETSPARFVEWLKVEDRVYWISGKPGSGKSTLMKFVAEHEQTKSYLVEWSGDKKLVIANFYFWNASTHQSQKSQRGLLRTILYQILRQCPELIQTAYREQWIALTSDGKVLKESRDELLTVPALLKTLRNISTSTASDTKFCFFLDGLDEFDGRPADIIELVDILKTLQNVKTCVSSRPWNEFEDRFGKDSPWKLFVHEFTRGDIHLYVEETLGTNSRFQQLLKEDPECPNFVWSIVWDADGVFLWVFLVTRSILDGLTNSDRIKDLQGRLKETPKDLQDYFKSILFSTENRYRTQTARMLSIAVHAVGELPLMAYWVIDQEEPKYFLKCPVGLPEEGILVSRLSSMDRRLKVLSKGLLEWDLDPQSQYGLENYVRKAEVNFLHRTVKDYLQTPDAQSMLQSWTDTSFNTDWEICNALGTLAKMMRQGFPNGSYQPHVETLFCYIYRLDQDPIFRTDVVSLLDHLQESLAPGGEEGKVALVEKLYSHKALYSLLKAKYVEVDIGIISTCVYFGIYNYVSDKCEKRAEHYTRLTNTVPTLVWSMHNINGLSQTYRIPVNKECGGMLMLQLLLTHGVDPNGNFLEMTEWAAILQDLGYYKTTEEEVTKSFEGIKLLLRHGADIEQECTLNSGGVERKVKACELLKEWYDADQFAVLEDIVKRRETKNKKKKHGIAKKMGSLKLWIASKK
ncbi:hypothetical protein L207DRAFT_514949 [Hyaloscypha variabilis F]|uniref:Uncharacterized protein n=1 Tax=Hyaloscypha variabilis (strain UAMH 11265 / GT02V1 / F) TaxID=1149755 RepID=A0A2J6RH13_HYAVF|nr:hypothetical protein L207DRAFT_514949 [Hyaloscypha variabilis F]